MDPVFVLHHVQDPDALIDFCKQRSLAYNVGQHHDIAVELCPVRIEGLNLPEAGEGTTTVTVTFYPGEPHEFMCICDACVDVELE
jgi:hypothetical protein